MTTVYTAQWVLPVADAGGADALAIADGAVAVEGAYIIGIGTSAELATQFPEAARRDFGAAAIVPGFVNCHTHLELTAMRGYLEDVEVDFFRWLRKLTLARMFRLTEDDLRVAATWGAVEAARAGVTALGDAASAGAASLHAVRDVGLRGTVYQEVFGPDANDAAEQSAKLRERVAGLRDLETARARVGVSPHASYTVSAPLLELVTDFALNENLPLMMHAAESEAETLLVRDGRGAFADNFRERGIEWHAANVSPIQYLARVGVLRARPLLAHCIRVDDAEIETLRQAGACVAHCPKSNAKLGHGHAPLLKFANLTHGFGSDSVARNNPCDVLEEARFALLAARVEGAGINGELYTPAHGLRVATRGGAEALGLGAQTGALVVGHQADLAIVRLDGAHQLPVYDPASALVFASSGRDVVLTVVAGGEIYRDGRVTTVDEEQLRARMSEIAAKLSG